MDFRPSKTMPRETQQTAAMPVMPVYPGTGKSTLCKRWGVPQEQHRWGVSKRSVQRRLPLGRTISAAPWAWSPRWAATCTASTTGLRGTNSSWFGYARLADSSASTERREAGAEKCEVYKLLRSD